VLALPPADPDGSVFAAALLAERVLPPDEASAQAQAWIRSFDDDEKRAGALLAALLGAHAALLERALASEDIPRVRTTLRLALIALGRDGGFGDEDPREFAHRTLRGADGDFNPDAALCMLAAGEPVGITLLSYPLLPEAEIGPALQRRAWLLERFVPDWYTAVGRPTGGDRRGAALYVDRLEALRLLCARRARYDPVERIFVTSGMTPLDALAAPPPGTDDGPP
jgi:hypothetical protein